MNEPALQEDMFYHGEWFPSELKVLEEEEEITTAEWAERYIHVVKSAKPGPWRNANNPPLVGIMNIADREGIFENTRTEVICKGVQTGGTVAAFNIIFKRMDKSALTAMLVMETDKKAKKTSNQRIQPTLKKSPRLAAQLSPNPDDTNNYSIILKTGFCLNIGWSGSEASVSGDPCEVVVIDETDKYSKPMNIEEAKDRTTTFVRTGLNVILSTPGLKGGLIIAELNNCDTIMDYYAECPDCGELQIMVFDQFTWAGKEETPKNDADRRRTANKVLREKSARYICKGCGVMWDDFARNKAVRLGERHHFHGWKMREDIDFPVSIGIHFPSWISPFKSLSAVVARWLKANTQEGRELDGLRKWYNNEAAQPFIEKHSERKVDEILALKDDRLRGVVPQGISGLALVVDTQMRGFYYEVRAFGWGRDLESWQIREGYVESEKALEDILYRSEYEDAQGKKHVIRVGIIDSGGGTSPIPKHTRTAEVYDFCRRNPIMMPLKGQQRKTTPWTTTHLDYYPKSKKRIPGGLTLYLVDVTYFKNQLSQKLTIHPDDPGAWHLHSECPEEYARHMCAEYKDDKARWQPLPGKPNHYWDVGVYSLALADILQIKFWKRPTEGARPSGRRVLSKGVKN